MNLLVYYFIDLLTLQLKILIRFNEILKFYPEQC